MDFAAILELPKKFGKLASLAIELVADAMNFPTSDDYDKVRGALEDLWTSVGDYDYDALPDTLDDLLANVGVDRQDS